MVARAPKICRRTRKTLPHRKRTAPAVERGTGKNAHRRSPPGAGGGSAAAARDRRARRGIAKAKEHQGRGGLEPVRYEDWEVKGLASDF